jgi:hypothetical protein
MVVRWKFFDPIDDETYVFPVNPNEGGTGDRTKNISQQATAAPEGKTLLFEGRDSPETINLSGVVLEQAQLDAFNTWFDKRHQIRVTDDLGRQYWAYMTRFSATRNRRRSHPWHHSYTMELLVVDQG